MALAIYDFKKYILPDEMNFALAISALAYHWLSDWAAVTWVESLAGAIFGSGLFLILKIFYQRVRNIQALGMGDVKFMIGAGLWVGIWQISLLITMAALSTLAVAGVAYLSGKTNRKPLLKIKVPYGPGLSIALIILLLDNYIFL